MTVFLGLFWKAASLLAMLVGYGLSFFRWLLRDIEDAFREPQRLAVRMVCLLAALAFGVWCGLERRADQIAAVTQERNAARAENKDWRDKYAEQEIRAGAADRARGEAEGKLRAELEAADARARAAAAKRMRDAPVLPAGAAKKETGPSVLQSLQAVFGAGK